MTHEVIRQEEARLLGRFEAYPVNGRKTNTGTIKMIRKEIGNMTFRIARKCNVSVNYPRWSIQGSGAGRTDNSIAIIAVCELRGIETNRTAIRRLRK